MYIYTLVPSPCMPSFHHIWFVPKLNGNELEMQRTELIPSLSGTLTFFLQMQCDLAIAWRMEAITYALLALGWVCMLLVYTSISSGYYPLSSQLGNLLLRCGLSLTGSLSNLPRTTVEPTDTPEKQPCIHNIANTSFGPKHIYRALCTIKTPEMRKPPYSIKPTGSPIPTVPDVWTLSQEDLLWWAITWASRANVLHVLHIL